MDAEQIQFTPVVESKIRLFYQMVSGNKEMGHADYAAWAERIIKNHNLPKDHKLAKEVREWFVNGWDRIYILNKEKQPETELLKYAEATKILKEGGSICTDFFTDAFKELIVKNPKLSVEVLQILVGTCFEVYDRDSDGFISQDEVTLALKNFGFDSPEMVTKIFKNLKEESCEKLSKEQYVNAWLQFFLASEC